MPSTVVAVSFDAIDAQAIATFWAQVLGRTVSDGASPDHAWVDADPEVRGSRIGFQRVPEAKASKNRMHFDLLSTDFEAEANRIIGLGASKLNEVEHESGVHWVTFADPEGNEFDLVAG
jgi:predicted enzyme related to lactoylglutathione lyase